MTIVKFAEDNSDGTVKFSEDNSQNAHMMPMRWHEWTEFRQQKYRKLLKKAMAGDAGAFEECREMMWEIRPNELHDDLLQLRLFVNQEIDAEKMAADREKAVDDLAKAEAELERLSASLRKKIAKHQQAISGIDVTVESLELQSRNVKFSRRTLGKMHPLRILCSAELCEQAIQKAETIAEVAEAILPHRKAAAQAREDEKALEAQDAQTRIVNFEAEREAAAKGHSLTASPS